MIPSKQSTLLQRWESTLTILTIFIKTCVSPFVSYSFHSTICGIRASFRETKKRNQNLILYETFDYVLFKHLMPFYRFKKFCWNKTFWSVQRRDKLHPFNPFFNINKKKKQVKSWIGNERTFVINIPRFLCCFIYFLTQKVSTGRNTPAVLCFFGSNEKLIKKTGFLFLFQWCLLYLHLFDEGEELTFFIFEE